MNSFLEKPVYAAVTLFCIQAVPASSQEADGRDGLCGTPEQVAAVQSAEGYSVLFLGQSTKSGENTVILGDENGTSFAVVLTYPEEWCIVFSGTSYQTFDYGEFGK